MRFGLLEIEGERLLAPVEPDEIGREALDRGVVGAGEVAPAGPLDLDDFGAEIGQMPGAERSGNGLFEREHANSGQWRRGHGGSLRRRRIVGDYRRPAVSRL